MTELIATGLSRFATIEWIAETGSTNDDLLTAGAAGAPEGTVLSTDHQTKGRGRLDRRWEAPPGSALLFSVLLRPGLRSPELGAVLAAVGIAVVESVRARVGDRAGLKWPNDVVVEVDSHPRKLAGILAEERAGAVVVGVGLNCSSVAVANPAQVGVAIGLDDLGGGPVDRAQLLIDILARLEHWYATALSEQRRDELWDRYRVVSATIGRSVRVQRADGSIEGRAVDITSAGHLLVDVPGAASSVEITTGDVVHLRHPGQ